MPFKMPEAAKIWRRRHKALLREEERTERRSSLHVRMGIETYVHRQAVLDDHRMGRRYDWTSRSWNHQHNYRESITLAKVLA